jgi:hypothetical protein
MIGRMTGTGAYTTNSLMLGAGGRVAQEVPVFSSSGDETGAIRVTKKEHVRDIYAPATGVAFANQEIEINPGLEASFPWLSQLAANYEEYDLLQCVYTYRSTTTDIGSSTTGQCGTLVMATQYNSSAPAFSDKAEMMGYDGAMSCKLTEDMLHGVECDDSKLSGVDAHYIRTGPVPAGIDRSSYDHAKLNLAIVNAPSGYANQVVGELWVSYTVILRKPKISSGRGDAIQTDMFLQSGANTTLTVAPIGRTNILEAIGNSIGTQLDTSVDNQVGITFPDYYAGDVDIEFRAEVTTSHTKWWQGSLQSGVGGTGNITLVRNMYAAGLGEQSSATNPESYIHCHPNASTSTTATNGVVLVRFRCRVAATTGGIKNKFIIIFDGSTRPSTIHQAVVTVTECTDRLAAKHTMGTGYANNDFIGFRNQSNGYQQIVGY